MFSNFFLICLLLGGSGAKAFTEPTFEKLEERKVKQPLDHGNPQAGFYEQNVQILKPKVINFGTPVVFFLGSEAGPGDLKKMSAPFRKHGAIIAVQADHRGYGSYSTDLDQTIPLYVTMDQAIEDFHLVLQKLKSEFSGPIFLVGYSYSATLAIMLAARYPDVAKGVYASSATVQFPAISSAHDEKMRASWSPKLYNNFSNKIHSFQNARLGQSEYADRLFLQTVFVGSVQYGKFAALKPFLKTTAALRTSLFLKSWKKIDKFFANGMADEWSTGQSTLKLNLAQAKTKKYNSRFWAYQQCNELGSFFTSSQIDSVFPQTFQDYSDYCIQMFGIAPKIKNSWDIKDLIEKMNTPIVVVNGANDPWLDIQILPDEILPRNSKYLLSQKGFHCPDREDSDLETQAISSLFKLIR